MPYVVPTPLAAAPPLAPPSSSKPQVSESLSSTAKRGFIRLDGIPSTSGLYINKERDSTGSFWTTVQAKDRILVEIEVKVPPRRIKVLVRLREGGSKSESIPSDPKLASCRTLKGVLGWLSSGNSSYWVEKGSTKQKDFYSVVIERSERQVVPFYRPAGLVAVNESGKFHCKDTREEWAGPHRSIIWSIAMDGTIPAWWEEGGKSGSITPRILNPGSGGRLMRLNGTVACLMEAVYRESDHLVMFVADPDTYIKKYPEWKQVVRPVFVLR